MGVAWFCVALVGCLALLGVRARYHPAAPSVSPEDRQRLGPALDRFLEGTTTFPGSGQACAEHLIEVTRHGEDVRVAAWAECTHTGPGVTTSSASSRPVLVTGRMTDGAFDPQRVVEPRDGDYLGDVRRLFSRAAATEILRHRPYDLHPEGLAG